MGGDVLIQNAAMVLPNGIKEGDLRVKSGIIQTIAPNGGLDHHPGELLIDATGLYLLPGAIDPHVHFEIQEILRRRTLKVVVGPPLLGNHIISDMPNTVPNATSKAELEFRSN